jgi:hypothetical protein
MMSEVVDGDGDDDDDNLGNEVQDIHFATPPIFSYSRQ